MSDLACTATEARDGPLLLGQLLLAPLATRPGQAIVYAGRRRHDYRTLRARIGRLASALADLGVRPGDTVAVMDWDSHRYLECFFAVPMMGAVLHSINVRLSPEQIRYTIDHADDAIILAHTDFHGLLADMAPAFTRSRPVIGIEDGPGTASPLRCVGEYEALLEAADPAYPFPELDENTRATSFYTTGTTGNPKGVWYTHRKLVLHTLALTACLGSATRNGGFHRDDVYMPMTPMFHVHAWGVPYAATGIGVKQVYPGRYEPGRLLALIRDEGVTFSHCVPTILAMLLDHPDASRTDLSRLKVIVGGSAMPGGLARRALDHGIDVTSGYCMSETGPVLTVAHLDDDMLTGDEAEVSRRCRTGRPLPLVDLQVLDEQGAPLPTDGTGVGEVVVRAPWLTAGYLAAPQASDALWSGGVLHTGDLGHLDADGFLQVSDRLKDVIKSGGEWISSLTLEDLVSRHPDVAEAAVIGVPDARWGERPLVLVVRRETAPALDAEAIRGHLEGFVTDGSISPWAVPERVEFVEAIDKTSVGKIDKKRLRVRYG
jgi:fatty-acyl-CoA synthase